MQIAITINNLTPHQAAVAYREYGWSVMPIRPGTKKPYLDSWKHLQDQLPTIHKINEWWAEMPRAQVAVITGSISGIVVVDVDSSAGEQNILEYEPPSTLTARTDRGRHLIYRHPGGRIHNRQDILPGIDIRGDGGYFVASPSIHPDSSRYAWVANGVTQPVDLSEELHGLLTGSVAPTVTATVSRAAIQAEGQMISDGRRNGTLFTIGSRLRGLRCAPEEIEAALLEVNQTRCIPAVDGVEVEKVAGSAARYPTGSPENYTDLGNARRLVKDHGHELRYVGDLSRWLVWNGAYWEYDQTGEVDRRARQTTRGMYVRAGTLPSQAEQEALGKWAIASESRRKLADMIALAASEPEIAIRSEQLDRDPFLLTVGNGTIDLRTGSLRSHDPTDLITRGIPTEYDPQAQAPLWEQFLATITAGDEELLGYLQRAVGYSLTGDVSEQVLFFCYGTGANGKSTFLDTLLRLLGRYGKQADPNLLITRNGDTHPTNMADLMGSRLVVCSESDDGKILAEATMKQLTGGDPIKARFMRQDFFQFDPSHKLWLMANHKPIVRGTDDGVWRRIMLVPFAVTIPAGERDRDLGQKLQAEFPGVLAWAVQGCLEWRRLGLRAPRVVVESSNDYRSEMDVLADFISECCERGSGYQVGATALYGRYHEWCDANGLKPPAQQSFGRKLTERGIERRKSTRGVIFYEGLRLRAWGEQVDEVEDLDEKPYYQPIAGM